MGGRRHEEDSSVRLRIIIVCTFKLSHRTIFTKSDKSDNFHQPPADSNIPVSRSENSIATITSPPDVVEIID